MSYPYDTDPPPKVKTHSQPPRPQDGVVERNLEDFLEKESGKQVANVAPAWHSRGMETTTDQEELFRCETCDRMTDRTVGFQVAPDEWETFAICETCAEEAREWNDRQAMEDQLSDEELEAIIREEEAFALEDARWAEENEVF